MHACLSSNYKLQEAVANNLLLKIYVYVHAAGTGVHLLGEIDPSGASRSRLIIVSVANKGKLQITALIFFLQFITQLHNVVLDCLDPTAHGSSAIHQKTKINLCTYTAREHVCTA